MAKIGYCHNCEHWNHVYDTSSEKWGTCTNEWVEDKVKVSEEFNPDVDDMKGVFTEHLFGCMYFSNGGENVVAKI